MLLYATLYLTGYGLSLDDTDWETERMSLGIPLDISALPSGFSLSS